jgi:hypothetical protein
MLPAIGNRCPVWPLTSHSPPVSRSVSVVTVVGVPVLPRPARISPIQL